MLLNINSNCGRSKCHSRLGHVIKCALEKHMYFKPY